MNWQFHMNTMESVRVAIAVYAKKFQFCYTPFEDQKLPKIHIFIDLLYRCAEMIVYVLSEFCSLEHYSTV